MTYISATSPLTVHFSSLLSKLPKLHIGSAIDGFCASISKAVCLAYVDPFTARRPRREMLIDAELEGRDPNW